MTLGSKSILFIGLIAWMSISCTESEPGQDSSISGTEFSVADSTSMELPYESVASQMIDTSNESNTNDRIENAQQKLRDQLDEGNTGQNQTAPKYRLDVEPYNYFADSEGYVRFRGRTLAEIQKKLGDAPIVVKQSIKDAPIRKEVRVYMPYAEDTTGLYLFIQNEIVLDFKLDEFNGIQNSSILEFFESR
jgi:hypothetical protein